LGQLGNPGQRAERPPRDDRSSNPSGFINLSKETTMNTITSQPLRTLVAGAISSALAFSFATVSRADDGTAPRRLL
jgi:hypothetical protein